MRQFSGLAEESGERGRGMVVEFFGHNCSGKTTLFRELQSRRNTISPQIIFPNDAKRRILGQYYKGRGLSGLVLSAFLQRSDLALKYLTKDRIYPMTLQFDDPSNPLFSFSERIFSDRCRDASLPSDVCQEFHLMKAISLRHALQIFRIEKTVLMDESIVHRLFRVALLEKNPIAFARSCLDTAPLPVAAFHVHETPDLILERIGQRRRHLVRLYTTAGIPEKAVELSFAMRDILLEKGVPVCTIQPTQCRDAAETAVAFLNQSCQSV
jgi:hypothetical protein